MFAALNKDQAVGIAHGYNHYYCLPNKQLNYCVMNFLTVFDSIQKTGGASYNVFTCDLNPSSGYMVATAGFEKRYPVPADVNKFQDAVIAFMANRNVWAKLKENDVVFYLGFWVYEGELFIDVAEWISDKQDAVSLGIKRNQIAIFDCERQQDIILPTKEELIKHYVESNIY